MPWLQVRRQIYIIRTSGARLLALINDVMDAAALRQNKLVLKQETVRSGLWHFFRRDGCVRALHGSKTRGSARSGSSSAGCGHATLR